MQFAASVDALVSHLENTQWWPEDIMRRHQFELVKPIVAHAYQTVPWYRRRFDELGLTPDQVADPQRFRTIPPLTRRDIQNAGEALHSTDVPSGNGKVWRRWTSGSTAEPVMVLRTELTGRFWIANTIREYRWQGWEFDRKVAVIRPTPAGQADPPNGATLENWGPATTGRIETGPCAVLSVKSTTAQQAAWLVREQPSYLQAYPLVAFELAKYFLRTGRQLPSIEKLHTFGGVVDSKVREACRRAWGIEILDAYSANEVGHIAIECVDRGGYHVQAEHLMVEVLDDSGIPCAPAQTGRVVITDLFNYAMPLLRYDIGDYAEVADPCACGRKLPALRRILGRERNMFVLPDGEKRWPALEIDALTAFEGRLPVRQFQAIQHSRTELEVKLVVARPLSAQEETGIRRLLATWFSDGFSVQFTYVDHIPPGPTGKFEDFRCELSHDR
jgi:phenylacetate-coenzyme A ligase PaaK-like adenylate-forming protein